MFQIAPTHPLAATLGDTAGAAVAEEQRDGAVWRVVDFPGYGSHCAAAEAFIEV